MTRRGHLIASGGNVTDDHRRIPMTDGHHSLAALLALDEQFQVLAACLGRVNDLVLITEAEPIDLPGPRILYVNNALMRLTGFTRDEVLGQTPRIFQGPRTQRVVLAQIREAMMQWRPSRVELINYTKQREEIWIELDISPVADANGWYTHWVSIARDITERKRAEAALASTRALAATTLDALPMPVCVLDDDGRIVSIYQPRLARIW
jgi:PAS domain S-box-containing protein